MSTQTHVNEFEVISFENSDISQNILIHFFKDFVYFPENKRAHMLKKEEGKGEAVSLMSGSSMWDSIPEP